jgi:ribonuclease Z
MTFSLTVLGSNSAIPTLTRNPSAHLLNVNERLFLIDCAEGTQLQIRRYHVKFQRIRHILITHLHGDHFYGLIGLLTSFHLLGRKDELHLYGHPLLKEIIDLQLAASASILNYPLLFHPLRFNSYDLIYEDDKVTVHSFPLIHSVPTCGFIFHEKKPQRGSLEGPRSFAYCSDTAYSELLLPYIHGCSLLYHETTFMQNMARNAQDKMHSTTIEAATIALKAQVKKLMIGHFSARYDDLEPLLEEARTIFSETILAEDGLTVQI